MLEGIRDINLVSIFVRILLSLLLGGILGYERGMKNRPAGFRTYMLVCLGSALVMMTNQYIFKTYNGGDIVRMGAQVISGIGFLGAGTIIITGRQQIKGITTAAGLWASACCGLAIGIGFYEGAILGGITIFVVMALMNRMEISFRKKSPIIDVYLEYGAGKNFSEFLAEVRAHNLEVLNIQMNNNMFAKDGSTCVILNIDAHSKRDHQEVLGIIGGIEGVDYLEEL
ncbi:MAG: MgtC/SapB family protein [Lachnospiraceae bacterium]|nr:MgtC/SapB family protein [Lachnospiraceae bacterium]